MGNEWPAESQLLAEDQFELTPSYGLRWARVDGKRMYRAEKWVRTDCPRPPHMNKLHAAVKAWIGLTAIQVSVLREDSNQWP